MSPGTSSRAPTYIYIGSALFVIGAGLLKAVVLHDPAATGYQAAAVAVHQPSGGFEALTILLVMRAFASGSVALTGTEAIANGVPAFKPPEAQNAARTLMTMAALLAVIFIGVTAVAVSYGILPSARESVPRSSRVPRWARDPCSTSSRRRRP